MKSTFKNITILTVFVVGTAIVATSTTSVDAKYASSGTSLVGAIGSGNRIIGSESESTADSTSKMGEGEAADVAVAASAAGDNSSGNNNGSSSGSGSSGGGSGGGGSNSGGSSGSNSDGANAENFTDSAATTSSWNANNSDNSDGSNSQQSSDSNNNNDDNSKSSGNGYDDYDWSVQDTTDGWGDDNF